MYVCICELCKYFMFCEKLDFNCMYVRTVGPMLQILTRSHYSSPLVLNNKNSDTQIAYKKKHVLK